MLIVTDASQSRYIVGGMAAVALRNLGYQPCVRLKKISEQETEFYPVKTCLQAVGYKM